MINYIIPKEFEKYIASKIKDPSQLSEIVERIYSAISSVLLDKKKNGKKYFYSFNIDLNGDAHRVIFEKIKIEGSSYFVLRDFAWTHNYEQALRWRHIGILDSKDDLLTLSSYKDGYQEITVSPTLDEKNKNSRDDQEDNSDQSSDHLSEVYYQKNWYALTPKQQEIMEDKSFPTLLVGPPGSGKTLIAMGLLQDQAVAHCMNPEANGVMKLLYISENPVLVKKSKELWKDFALNFLPQNQSKVVVKFLTINEYMEWYAQSQELTINEEILTEKLTPNEQIELIHNADYFARDIKAGKRYDVSEYKNAGAKNTLFAEEQRTVVYNKIYAFLNKLNKKTFIPNVSFMQMIESGFEYDFIVVDEAQKACMSFLLSILNSSKNNQVLYIGDTMQKGRQQFSTLDALRSRLHSDSTATLTVKFLTNTLRLKKDVAEVANSLVLLHNNLQEGKPAISYTTLTDKESHLEEESKHVFLLNPLQTHIHDKEIQDSYKKDYQSFTTLRAQEHDSRAVSGKDERYVQEKTLVSLGKNANAAAIILREEDRIAAEILIQGSSVFNIHEVCGLEFSEAVLFFSRETMQQFRQVATAMKEKGLNAYSELKHFHNQSPQKDKKENSCCLISDLLVAISRTTGNLYVYMEEPHSLHALSPFIPWFKKQLGEIPASLELDHVNPVNKEEWMQAINRYIGENLIYQAKGALKNIFELDDDRADKYIKFCQQTAALDLEEFMQWCEKEKRKAAIAAERQTKNARINKGATAAGAPHDKSSLNNGAASTGAHNKACMDNGTIAASASNVAPDHKTGSDNGATVGAPHHKEGMDAVNPSEQKNQNVGVKTAVKAQDSNLELISNVVAKLNDNFNLNRLTISFGILEKYAQSFWVSPLAKVIFDKMLQNETTKSITLNYYVNLKSITESHGLIQLINYARNKDNEFSQKLHWLGNLRNKCKQIAISSMQSNVTVLSVICGGKETIESTKNIEKLHQMGANLDLIDENGLSALMMASSFGNIETIKTLAKLKANLDQEDNLGKTAAYHAISHKEYKALETLGNCGANLNKRDPAAISLIGLAIVVNDNFSLEFLCSKNANLNSSEDGKLPTCLAVEQGNIAALKILIKYKADLTQVGIDGKSPALIAAEFNQVEVLEILGKINPNLLSQMCKINNQGFTPASIAAHKSNLDIFKVLHKFKVNLNEPNESGITPACIALSKDNVKVLKLLHDLKVNINKPDKFGMTFVHLAAGQGYNETLKFLKKINANFETLDGYGLAPLHHAARNGNIETILLLEKLNVNLKQKGKGGATAVHYAAQGGQFDTLRFLKNCNLDINQPQEDGRTAVHFAAEEGHYLTLKILKELGAKLNQLTIHRHTALHFAIMSNYEETIRLLADEINVNQPDIYGLTPLHFAARHGGIEAIDILIGEYNAESLPDKYGLTPMHGAAMSGDCDVIRQLHGYNVPINPIDIDGKTPLQHATEQNHNEACALLIELEAQLSQHKNEEVRLSEAPQGLFSQANRNSSIKDAEENHLATSVLC